MLDNQALNQLQGLKQKMESEKERAEAVLRGAQGRYGFARLDDGREVFVPPDEMLKALPGDRVAITIRPAKDKRPVAEIDRLVNCPLQEFTGRCLRKGKALFVQPDLPHLRRWLFLPPQARAGAREGERLRCALLRHPIRDGKPQAKVLERIGVDGDPGIENRYVMAKYGLQAGWSEADSAAAQALLENTAALDDPGREDLEGLDFVSIDAARTQDIDDALYAEVTSDGWVLYVAVADPSAYIAADSPLRDALRQRGSSVYFHGAVAPMLPECLAQEHCALMEDARRPALVCRMAVSEHGEIGEFRFIEARIRSRAKLSYYAVDRYLNGQNEALICHATPLEALYQAYRALRARREAQELVMEERQEYRWVLDDEGRIETIEPCEKLLSQRLVEECMVATNRCAARFLNERRASGPFVAHDGFRRDRHKDRERFIKQFAPEFATRDLDTLEGYRDLIRHLSGSNHELPLRSMLNRLLTRARLAIRSAAHMGMSLPTYTNCTSPLRKYLDFLVHLQIKSLLRDEPAKHCDQLELDALSKRLLRIRQATQEADRWLAMQYLEKLSGADNTPWAGQVSHVDNHGFMVRLRSNGLEGYVDLRQEKEKFRYEKWTATHASKTRAFRIDTAVEVSLAGTDEETPHLALFKLTPASGQKPQAPATSETGEVAVEAGVTDAAPEAIAQIGATATPEVATPPAPEPLEAPAARDPIP